MKTLTEFHESLQALLNADPYALPGPDAESQIRTFQNYLTAHHYERCAEYRQIIDALGFHRPPFDDLSAVPYLPVPLFKRMRLSSVDEFDVVKVIASSGTSGQIPSTVTLDKTTATNQSRALTALTSTVWGKQRRPMVILDSRTAIEGAGALSARGAGILGFSRFGRSMEYALDAKMDLRFEEISAYLTREEGEPVLFYGFTSLIWQYVVTHIHSRGLRFPRSNGTLVHGGGWKKLQDKKVSPETFRAVTADALGVSRVVDYYGMAEQTGSIFFECSQSNFHASNLSTVLIRRSHDFSLCGIGEPGLIQVLSVLPTSYPGHSLLTEDIGVLKGLDGCSCGRRGRYFQVIGRAQGSELRGCSDTHVGA